MAAATPTNEYTVGKYKDMANGRELVLSINPTTAETIIQIDSVKLRGHDVSIRFVFSKFTVSPQIVTITMTAPILKKYPGNTKTYPAIQLPSRAKQIIKDIADNKHRDKDATKLFKVLMVAVLNGLKSRFVNSIDFDEMRDVLRVWAS